MLFRGLSPYWDRLSLLLIIVSVNFYILIEEAIIKFISMTLLCVAIGFILIRFIGVVRELYKDFRKTIFEVKWSNEIMPEFANLIRRMNVKLDKKQPIGIIPDLFNAAARPNFRIIIGGALIEKLDSLALQAVFAHELAHLKSKHYLKYFVISMIIIMGILIYQSFFPAISGIMTFILALAAIILSFSYISWYFEYEADTVAKKYVGKEAVISELEDFKRIMDKDNDSFTHPSFSKRITKLKNE